MENLRDGFLEIIRGIKDHDPNKSPCFITNVALFKALKTKHLYHLASRVLQYVQIDVDESFVNDKELFDETIQIYADLIHKLNDICWAATEDAGFFWSVLKQNKIVLTYKND